VSNDWPFKCPRCGRDLSETGISGVCATGFKVFKCSSCGFWVWYWDAGYHGPFPSYTEVNKDIDATCSELEKKKTRVKKWNDATLDAWLV
jgi:transcription initiation factor IIE alpha subunit